MNRTILILVNHEIVIYNFRKELIEALLKQDYNVVISCPYGKSIDKLTELGAVHIDAKIDRHGVNLLKDIKLLNYYIKLMTLYRPLIVLTYTIKCNIYGGFAATLNKTPYIANITGLGTAVENKGLLQVITTKLYKVALKKANTIFFQNQENMDFMITRGIRGESNKLLPGSGVNINRFAYMKYPSDESLSFLFIGRLMKAKGIDYYLEAAKTIKSKYPNTIFHIVGSYEEDYSAIINHYQSKDYIVYHGSVDDVRKFIEFSHCIIHPTYYPEGISNVLLEASASGRPVIASNRSGCKEVVDHNINGYLVEPKNIVDLIDKIEQFIKLSYIEKKTMGIKGREKVETKFNREIINDSYLFEIKKISNFNS